MFVYRETTRSKWGVHGIMHRERFQRREHDSPVVVETEHHLQCQGRSFLDTDAGGLDRSQKASIELHSLLGTTTKIPAGHNNSKESTSSPTHVGAKRSVSSRLTMVDEKHDRRK